MDTNRVFFTENYIELIKKEHSKSEWGSIGGHMHKTVAAMADSLNTDTVIDYGCGHGSLRKALESSFPGKYKVLEYG